MKKVTAFVGSAHKKNTHQAVQQFFDNLQASGEVECEIVTLSDYNLRFCRGCRVCFEKGEALCPLKDDRDLLFEKIKESDGVIFASPNYSGHVSGIMKTFLDRFGYAYHRPRYFGKTFTSIVTQAFGGGSEIVKFFDVSAGILGFNTVKGITVTGFDPRTEKEEAKIEKDLKKLSHQFYKALNKLAHARPSFSQLMIFRIGRSTVRQIAEPESLDYRYYAERGWFETDYYYPTQLGMLKRAAGKLMDTMAATVRSMIA